LKDVEERTRLSVANQTLEALGFVAMPQVMLDAHLACWGWVHPAGAFLAGTGSVLGGGDPPLTSLRLSALVCEGMFPCAPGAADLQGSRASSWNDVTGEGFQFHNMPLDTTLVGKKSGTLLNALAGIQKQGQLEPFGRWESESRSDAARGWTFSVSDDNLSRIENAVGITKWLTGAPSSFAFFAQNRFDRRQQGTIPEMTPLREARGRLRLTAIPYLKALGVSTRRRYLPMEHRSLIYTWVTGALALSTYKKTNPPLDFQVLPNGFSQATAMVLSLSEPGNDAALLAWLKQAPKQTLSRVALEPDKTGRSLVHLLVRSVGHQLETIPVNNGYDALPVTDVSATVVAAFNVLVERLGLPAVQKALDVYGGPLGIALSVFTKNYVATEKACAGWLPLFRGLEEAGVHQFYGVAPTAGDGVVPAPLTYGGDDSPSRWFGGAWTDAFTQAVGKKSVMLDYLQPFSAWLRAKEFDLALPEASPEVRRGPRF